MTHGTRAAYQAGCSCVRCRAAEAQYRAHLRALQVHGREPFGRRIRSPLTAAHLRQLLEELTPAQVAALLGLKRPRVELHTRSGPWITVRNALKVKRLYRLRVE